VCYGLHTTLVAHALQQDGIRIQTGRHSYINTTRATHPGLLQPRPPQVGAQQDGQQHQPLAWRLLVEGDWRARDGGAVRGEAQHAGLDGG
jgi:hypothetical protein